MTPSLPGEPAMPATSAPTTPAYEGQALPIPDYLERHYWWAYVRPWGVKLFEREWLVNLILIGWYRRLRDAALEALGEAVHGKTLQISCCYGSFTPTLLQRIKDAGGTLDVLDVSPAQLTNLRRKIGNDPAIRILLRDSTDLNLGDRLYDRVILFFLPHEQPKEIRAQTLAQAWSVLKPGGTALIVEFGKPRWWHPLRYAYLPFLAWFEPFAPDIWGQAPETWLPDAWKAGKIERATYFGGYYQRLVITKPAT